MKCCIMRHFIKVCTVCKDTIDLQRKKNNIVLKNITLDTPIYIMDRHDRTVCSFMEMSIGLKKVNLSESPEIKPVRLFVDVLTTLCSRT